MVNIEKLKLLGDLVLVKRIKVEKIGRFDVRQALDGVQQGTILCMGPDCAAHVDLGGDVGDSLFVGDTVLFKEGTGQPFWWVEDRFATDAFDRDLLVMHEAHILGVLEPA
jgi:co-chaperonin GroES (HSP10)